MRAACCLALFITACGGDASRGPADGPTDRTRYPPGPYGRSVGSTIEDLGFVAGDGVVRTLSEARADEGTRLLLISTSAGWCSACIAEQPELVERHARWPALEVMVVLFEDADFVAADAEDAERWQRRYDLPFSVLADPPFVLGDYYDRSLTPMNMLIDADTMTILRIGTGWDPGAVDALVEARL